MDAAREGREGVWSMLLGCGVLHTPGRPVMLSPQLALWPTGRLWPDGLRSAEPLRREGSAPATPCAPHLLPAWSTPAQDSTSQLVPLTAPPHPTPPLTTHLPTRPIHCQSLEILCQTFPLSWTTVQVRLGVCPHPVEWQPVITSTGNVSPYK